MKTFHTQCRALLISAIALLSSGALASGIVQNGSFEAGAFTGPSYDNLQVGNNSLTAWTVYDAHGVHDGIDWYQQQTWDTFPAADGIKFVDLNMSGIKQDLNTVAGVNYTVTFVAARPYDVDPGTTISLKAWAGNGSVVAQPLTSIYNNINWYGYSFQFTASSSLTTLYFEDSTHQTNRYGVAVDDVHVVSTPAPGALATFGLSFLGGSIRRSRRNRAR